MVTNIGGISDKERAPLGDKVGLPIIAENDPCAMTESSGRKSCPRNQRGQRIDFHANQLRLRKYRRCSDQKSRRAHSRIDDACRCFLILSPSEHGPDDSRRGVGGTEISALLRCPEFRKSLAERILVGENSLAQSGDGSG